MLRVLSSWCFLCALTVLPLVAQSDGPIFVVGRTGSVQDAPSFPFATDVYLAGGARPDRACSGRGMLPDGTYIFQVTDERGLELLTDDDEDERQIVVTQGVFSRLVEPDEDRTAVQARCGVLVPLAPFEFPSNFSGMLLVWLTPVSRYDEEHGVFGFLPAHSYVEAFKVEHTALPGGDDDDDDFVGSIFYDVDGDGVQDPNDPLEVGFEGWRIEITDGVNTEVTYTDEDGRFSFAPPRDGRLWEVTHFAPGAGFVPNPGATWLATTSRDVQIALVPGALPPVSFGVAQLEVVPELGRTPEWWASAAGAQSLSLCDPAWRQALGTVRSRGFLRRPVFSTDPQLSLFISPLTQSFTAAFQDLAGFLQPGPVALEHAGHELSRQLAATILSATCGGLQGEVWIDRFGDGRLFPLRGMISEASALLANPCSGVSTPSVPANCAAVRQMILMCTNEFTTINRTQNRLERQVVFKPKLVPDTLAWPYSR